MEMLAEMTWTQWLLTALSIGICLLLILVVLVQRGRGGGLAGAFGGGGGSSAFGAKTGDVFTWITVILAVVFLLVQVAGNFVMDDSPDRVVAADTATAPSGAEPISSETITIPLDTGEAVLPVTLPAQPVALPAQPVTLPPAESDTPDAGTAENPDAGAPATGTETDPATEEPAGSADGEDPPSP